MKFKSNGELSFIYIYEQPNSVRRWNVPPYDGRYGYPHVSGRLFENEAIFETRQMPPDDSVDTIWRLFNQCGSMRMQQKRQKLSRQNLSLDQNDWTLKWEVSYPQVILLSCIER